MTGFKMKDWFLKKLTQVQALRKPIRARSHSLTGAMQRIVGTLRNQELRQTWWSRVRERSSAMALRLKEHSIRILRTADHVSKGKLQRMYRYRVQILGTIGIAAVIWSGVGYQNYVEANTYDIYHVFVKDQLVGTVSNPQIIDDFKIAKYKEIQEKYPNVHMVLNTDEIVLKAEKAYKGDSDDQAALAQLDQVVKAHAVGVELVVDGKSIGILKDQDTADQILSQLKSKFGGVAVAQKQQADKGKVSILSAEKNLSPGESEVQQVDFVQQVDIKQRDIDPDQVMSPDDVMKKLETGDVQPTKYTIEKGDSVSVIAKKFNISKQVIYENNPWIVDDMIKAGQTLDLTVLQPTLSVKTVEKVVERQEIQYDTEYVKDDSLRAGVVQPISPGKNGMKNVTFLVTKVNGKMMDEQMLNEEIIEKPVTAKAKKGTKVIVGEGSGKFAWPVVGSSISSGFGYRWGKLHKGVDLTGNRNILAADNGKVEYVGYTSDYGNHIIINHMNGYKTLYGHLSQSNVKVGQIVEKGERIGIMGSTGDSTGVHLHFEIQVGGNVENPLKYLNR